LLLQECFNYLKIYIEIINPTQYICTIIRYNQKLYIEIDIEKGKGYRLTEEMRRKNDLRNH
jgi:DNA-directed RNA polymerase alpha subunit